jgi:hypothetical protein
VTILNRTGPVEKLAGRVHILDLEAHTDKRGLLQSFCLDSLPFRPCRTFFVSNVPAGTVRGGHGHRKGQQLLVCVQGEIEVQAVWGTDSFLMTLRPGQQAFLMDAGVWCQQTYVKPGSVLQVFASEPYDSQSYIWEPST